MIKTLDLANEVGEVANYMANLSLKIFKTIHDLSDIDDDYDIWKETL